MLIRRACGARKDGSNNLVTKYYEDTPKLHKSGFVFGWRITAVRPRELCVNCNEFIFHFIVVIHKHYVHCHFVGIGKLVVHFAKFFMGAFTKTHKSHAGTSFGGFGAIGKGLL